MDVFYELLPGIKKDEIIVKSLIQYDFKTSQNLKVGKFIPDEPLRVKVAKGKKWYDIVCLQDPINFYISERVYKLLKDAGFTGWRSYRVAIEGRDEKYYGFQVLGKCGSVKRPKKTGFVIGFEFDYESWDGSDFFYPKESTTIFCTERVKKLMEASKVTNLEFEDIRTVEWYSV